MKIVKRLKYPLAILMVVMIFLTGCSSTSYEGSENIVEGSEVAKVYLNGDVKIIDARFLEDYKKGHLKGAISLTPGELSIDNPVKGLIASKETVENVLSNKGIKNDDELYIYDNNGGVYSSRLWWSLKIYGHENVKVINNGAKALENQGLEMSTDIPEFEKSNYKAKDLNKNMIAVFEDVKNQVEKQNENTFIIDARSLAEYDEGYISGAVLFPHTDNLYKDGTFKSKRDIYLNYNDLGIEKSDEVIVYCKTSFRAAQTMLLLKEAGFENVKIYDGAWSEWVNSSMPAEVKTEPEILTEQDAS
jgi:thiosulfate/3-mercaptopyruvate sulfurtransferase